MAWTLPAWSLPSTGDGNNLRGEQTMTDAIPKIERILYTAKAHTTGGRDGGSSRTGDGRLDVKFTYPGTPGTGTNPEQLFAAGWSTCLLPAIKNIAGKEKIALPDEAAIDVEVDLGIVHGGHLSLAARLNVSLPGVAPKVAQELVDAAHQHCPHSRATRGNIDVVINVKTELAAHAG
jgi:Ohr subfamily peroxiredoxin